MWWVRCKCDLILVYIKLLDEFFSNRMLFICRGVFNKLFIVIFFVDE